ncbi:hypothetical protein FLK61_26190 [Paenalkalicoccus suaedae]|uniref:Uncharacterized protein n=1 Tax=Paenalkalicoccus suaedae TaxID=2592382 RepID=A0A859FAD6_9BACI|nr:hypothetical protein [Paenalkalicoccus suaedae]QKS70253.1 hypothetical protein FLK61_26190 [Paenalkalicoccus suaedae]
MNPLTLQVELKKRFEREFANLRLERPDEGGRDVALQIFKQHLPANKKTSKDEKDSHYPCLIIQLDEGEISSEDEPQEVSVIFMAGVYDEQDDYQGYQDAFLIIDRVFNSLQKDRYIKGTYQAMLPMKWAYHSENAMPYFFTGLFVSFEAPKAMRQDVEAMI